jgi:heme-degrading monooxygenase HmoA
MPVTPWKTYQPPIPGTSYLALLSYLPLKHFRAVPKFFRFAYETMRQLRTSPGLIGYSMDARPFHRKFWTLSVWRDQQALMDFVRAMPHSRTMQLLAPHMGKSQFAHWTVESHEIPLDWNNAKARLPRV